VSDPRLRPPAWDAAAPGRLTRGRVGVLGVASAVLAVWYFGWLLHPARIGNPLLYAVLIVAELFNAAQALGFWWTVGRQRVRPRVAPPFGLVDVDVLIPVYDEPVDVVEPTVAAATRLRGARVHVALLDDAGRPDLEAVAARHGAGYVRRSSHTGAKAGNVNHALGRTSSKFVAIFDCDHVPDEDFLVRTLGHFAERDVALVQTPQHYANAGDGGVAGAAWAQQALFFGAIARGKDARGAMFCCGTNMVFRRAALEDAGGFPETSVTEDFELSIDLHQRGWRTVYVAEVLAQGLGPEDMASYVSQQHRWARGCVSALPRVLRSRLPRPVRLQYLLSSMFFLSGWTALVYMALPVVRILTGAQPLAGSTADQFLLHFAPYFGFALLVVAVAGAGSYTYAAFALTFATFWVHVHATLKAVLRRPGRFVVTPKRGSRARQPRAVWPSLVAIAVLAGVGALGLARDRSPATLNNVAFAALHVTVLAGGVRDALRRPAAAAAPQDAPQLTSEAA
jgi:cellulose synthase (UDP-forming)